ncbi:MAG: FxsA family protein [bacterium]
MALFLVLMLIILPIAEIYVLLNAGEAFGVWPVIFATIGTAVLGSAIIRWQGFAAMRRLQQDMGAGQMPVEAVVDGVFLLVAAPFLMTPGFITDGIGFLLLVPPIRHLIARYFLGRIKRSIDKGHTKIHFTRL